jgi:hypothetical protein
VDDDAREQANDLLTLLVRQSCVEAGPNLGQEVMDCLWHNLGTWSLYGVQAGLQLSSLRVDAVEFDVEVGIRESAADVEGDGLLALSLKRDERP